MNPENGKQMLLYFVKCSGNNCLFQLDCRARNQPCFLGNWNNNKFVKPVAEVDCRMQFL